MKKIIFEQLGNIISVILLTTSILEINNDLKVSQNEIHFSLGIYTLSFLVWIIIFTVLRYLYSKINKSYNFKKGEYSVADEREESISYKASVCSYKCVIFILLILLLLNIPLSFITPLNTISTYVFVTLYLSISIILGFLSYTLSWIYYYYK